MQIIQENGEYFEVLNISGIIVKRPFIQPDTTPFTYFQAVPATHKKKVGYDHIKSLEQKERHKKKSQDQRARQLARQNAINNSKTPKKKG